MELLFDVGTRILFLRVMAMIALALSLGCQAAPTPEPVAQAVTPTTAAYPAPPTLRPGYPAPEPSVPVPTAPPRPTMEPTPTIPPFLTHTPIPPTPVVTPIPTVTPPTLPGVVGKAQERFWLYAVYGNDLWRVDDQGQNAEFLLDVYEETGAWLSTVPDFAAEGTDMYVGFGPNVIVSPDGQKVALVLLVNKEATIPEPLELRLYVLDVPSGELKFMGEGTHPAWSPDSTRLAFLTDHLQVIEVESGTSKDFSLDLEQPVGKLVWSPDGSQLALVAQNPQYGSPGSLWLQPLDGSPAGQLLSWDDQLPLWGDTMQWSPDGESLLINGAEEFSTWPMLSRWYTVSTTTGEKTLLFPELAGGGRSRVSPDGEWWLFEGRPLYEPMAGLWLFHLETGVRYPLISYASDLGPVDILGWSPDGTRLLVRVWEPERKFYFYRFESGTFTELEFSEPIDAAEWGIYMPGGRDY